MITRKIKIPKQGTEKHCSRNTTHKPKTITGLGKMSNSKPFRPDLKNT